MPDEPSRSRFAVGRRGVARRGLSRVAGRPGARGPRRSWRQGRHPRATGLGRGSLHGLHSTMPVGRVLGLQFHPKELWPSRVCPKRDLNVTDEIPDQRSPLQPASEPTRLLGSHRRHASLVRDLQEPSPSVTTSSSPSTRPMKVAGGSTWPRSSTARFRSSVPTS